MRRGGAFIATGADTCVYRPVVACVQGTQSPAQYPAGDYVSRVVADWTPDGDEVEAQIEVKETIDRLQAKYPDVAITKHFNLAVATCTPDFKPEDLVNAAGKPCKNDAQRNETPGPDERRVNLITPAQGLDVVRKGALTHPLPETRREIQKLLHAVAYLNDAYIVHADAHFGNLAWMGDHIVMHDWGRTISDPDLLRELIEEYGLNTETGRRQFQQVAQFTTPCDLLGVCNINMQNFSDVQRFMKFYDVASIAGSMAKFNIIDTGTLEKFKQNIANLFQARKTHPLNEMRPQIEKYIDEMFVPSSTLLGGRAQMKTRMSKKFDKCVKSVRKTVRARKGSNKESAAIGICTKSVLQTRGRTMKRYRKGHLQTQKLRSA
jgi:hypothetical protein